MDDIDDSSSAKALIPLGLIVVSLVIVLCIRPEPEVTSARTNHTTGRTRSSLSQRHELEIPGEEEPLLPPVEAPPALPREGRQTRSTTEETLYRPTAEPDQWKGTNPGQAKYIAKLREDLSASVSQNVELQRQYDTLCRDLEGARVFLNTADTFADSEVIQAVQKLNTELQHTSISIADRVLSVFKLDVVISDPEHQAMVDKASAIIGSTFVQFLRIARRDDPEIPLYLQIAFQAYLTHRLCWIASSWTIDEWRSTFVSEIYRRLRETEKQSVSGRWRSLTRLYTLPTCVGEPNSLVGPIIAGLSHVLLAIGCTATESDVVSELSSMFDEKILAVIKLAGRVNQMIGGVVSGDFEVFVARPGDTFHGGIMEEDTDGGVQNSRVGTEKIQTVLCTTELGLSKRIQLGTGERETTTVIKAKVIPVSFLDTEN